jgi:protein-tyrosine-phosphatase
MAMALLRAKLAQDQTRRDWLVESAGTWATNGREASTYAIAEMAEREINLSSHQARAITREMLVESDLVLVMTCNHAEALKTAFPDLGHKIHLISQMVGKEYDICDPYGGSRMEYAYTAKELEALIEDGYARIVELVEGTASASSLNDASSR